MVEEPSPFQLSKDIAAFVARFVSNIDADTLPREQRAIVMDLRSQATDIRLEIRDYGTAETRQEQEWRAKAVIERLDAMQVTIVKASEYNLLGAADVAQLSAQLQQLIAVL